MQIRTLTFSTIFVLVALTLSPGSTVGQTNPPASTTSQETVTTVGPAQLPDATRKLLESDPERLIIGMLNVLRRHALRMRNRDGVATRESVAQFELEARARWRAEYVSEYLEFDLDGDGALGQEELKRLAEMKRPSHRMVKRIPIIDRDGDGRLSAEEIVAEADQHAGETRERVRNSAYDDVGNLMLFDQDGDGIVHPEEVTGLVETLAATATATGAPEPGGSSEEASACKVPRPPANARVVVLKGYEGGALSSVALLGRDSVTTVATLTVEPGEAPLYILAEASQIVIWKLEGATERVSHFVAQSGKDGGSVGTGVVGLPAENITFVPGDACLRGFNGSDDNAVRVAKSFLQARIGHSIDEVVEHYEFHGVSVPSGAKEEHAKNSGLVIVQGGKKYLLSAAGLQPLTETLVSPLPGFDKVADPATAVDLLRFHPGGLVRLDAGTVVAPAPVEAYDVLPDVAGLLQLIDEGSLRRISQGEYLIREPIPRFPAGLAGAHSVKFVLAPGVPMPDGDPMHSTVVRQETGECLAGPLCRN